jgi:hypothetical protein
LRALARGPSDNQGGILGSSLAGGSLPVRPLATAIQVVNQVLLAPDENIFAQKLNAFRQILPPSEEPPWWPSLCDALDEIGNDPIPSKDYHLGRIPTWIAPNLLFIPEITISTENLTSRPFISTDNSFVWAKDPALATKAFQQRLDSATQIVQTASELLKAPPFHSPPSPRIAEF